MEYSPQCRHTHLHYHVPPVFDQYWLHRRIQCHRLPGSIRLTGNLYHILYLPYLASHSGPTASIAPLVPRPLRYLCQRWRRNVSTGSLGICVLPRRDSCHTSIDELERRHVWRHYDIRDRLLSYGGKIDLHSPSGIGEEKFIGFSSVRRYVHKGCAAGDLSSE